MSVPPYSPPPGSYYPPPPKSSGNGCLMAAGIGCAVILLLFVIGGVMVYNTVKKTGVFKFGMRVGSAASKGIVIQRAVVQYHAKHGTYPNHLSDLTSDGEITDPSTLHNDLDSNPDPSHVSWTYTKPSADAPGATPILTEHYTVNMGLPNGPNSAPAPGGDLTINLDGTTGSAVAPVTPTAPHTN